MILADVTSVLPPSVVGEISARCTERVTIISVCVSLNTDNSVAVSVVIYRSKNCNNNKPIYLYFLKFTLDEYVYSPKWADKVNDIK